MSDSKVVRRVYADPQLAYLGGLEFFKQEEETVYITECVYPSGVEYHLKKKIIPGQKYEKVFELKKTHKFKCFEKAMKALKEFKATDKSLCVKKKYKEINGYKFVKYHYLCSM